MEYLQVSEYATYGLAEKTPESLVAAASAMIDAQCRRPTLAVAQYTERFRLTKANTVRLSYLPLTPATGASSALVAMRARFGAVDRDWFDAQPVLHELLQFASPSVWIAQDCSQTDVNALTGEVMFTQGLLGLPMSEVELTYTAGFATIPEAVKQACAQIVRNAQATPALNVRASQVDRMHMQYFSDTLLDSTVQTLLQQFVAQKAG